MPNKRAVVTGGAGFIGSHLVDALLERGYRVEVIDSLRSGKRERVDSRAHIYEIDVCDYAAVAPLVRDVDVVFHLAALPSVPYSIENPEETHAVNVGGTLSMLRAAHAGGVRRFVYAASSSAYGNQERHPLSEELPASPQSPYGLQKHIGELHCRLWSEIFGLPTVSLRFFNVYGPRLDPEGPYALVIGRFLKQRVTGEALTITGDGEQTRDFIHVRDIARALVLAGEAQTVGKGEVINIGAGKDISIKDLAALIGGPTVNIPSRTEPSRSCADTRKARALLGWEPSVSLEEGIGELKKEFGIAP